MISFEVDGIEQIGAELTRRAGALDAGGRKLAAEYGEHTRSLTYQLSPVDTGFMRDHIRTEILEGGLGFETGWRHEDFSVEGLPPYYIFQEFGTVKMAAQPSLGPAWNELEPQYIGDADDLLRRSIIEGR